jgi:hypothetical protein
VARKPLSHKGLRATGFPHDLTRPCGPVNIGLLDKLY